MRIRRRIMLFLLLSSIISVFLILWMPVSDTPEPNGLKHVKSNLKHKQYIRELDLSFNFSNITADFKIEQGIGAKNMSYGTSKMRDSDNGIYLDKTLNQHSNSSSDLVKRTLKKLQIEMQELKSGMSNSMLEDARVKYESNDHLHKTLFNAKHADSELVYNNTMLGNFAEKVKNCITGSPFATYNRETVFTQQFIASKTISAESIETRKESFKNVFDTRAWGQNWDFAHKGLNASGMGSTLYWTQEMIGTLHVVLNSIKFHLKKEKLHVLDSACGDFVWMSRFLKTRPDIYYTGVDIVPDLIEHHKKEYGGYKQWRFREADILDDSFEIKDYDLIINRMMLQHLYNADVLKLLEKFSNSGSHFVLLTTFSSHSENRDLDITRTNPGRFRCLNLELPPISLSPPICLQRDGPIDAFQGWDHFIGLWKLPLQQVKFCDIENQHEYRIKDTPAVVHTCTFVQEL